MKARIVFDLDGTLIDSAPDINGVANRMLAPHGAQITLAQTHRFIGNGVSAFITRMLEEVALPQDLHDEILPAFQDAYLTAVTLTQPYRDVADVLAQLAQAGHLLGICTNKPISPCMAVLDHLALTPHFSTFWGGDSLAVRKPDPAPLNAAFEALGTDTPRIYVGDSEVDAQTAVNAQVPFLLFSKGYRKAEVSQIPHNAVFDAYADLPALISQYAE